jgi:hypothetical protein
MERLPHTLKDADELLRLSDLLHEAALTIKDEWAKEDFSYQDDSKDTARILPSHKLWNAERTVEAVTGALVELVASSKFWQSLWNLARCSSLPSAESRTFSMGRGLMGWISRQ